jgi:Putative glycerate kinase
MPEQMIRDHLRQIFSAALQRIDPYRMLLDHVRLAGDRLLVDMENERHEIDLSTFRRVLVLGAGKASARMGRAIEDILGDRVSGGCIVTKYGHAEPLERIEVLEAGHPVPDENGVRAARKIADLADQAGADTLVLALISGGGSALLPSPLEIEVDGERIVLTLADKRQATRELLACGADIGEINCVRKHLSGLKGGRLLQRLFPARSCNFILSDLVGDHLDTIASGITAHDRSTFAQAAAVIDKYGLDARVSPKIMHVLRLGLAGRIPDTVKLGDPALDLARNILIGTNHAAMLAACETAASLGYNVAPLTCMLTGEAREAAQFISGIAQDVRRPGNAREASGLRHPGRRDRGHALRRGQGRPQPGDGPGLPGPDGPGRGTRPGHPLSFGLHRRQRRSHGRGRGLRLHRHPGTSQERGAVPRRLPAQQRLLSLLRTHRRAVQDRADHDQRLRPAHSARALSAARETCFSPNRLLHPAAG